MVLVLVLVVLVQHQQLVVWYFGIPNTKVLVVTAHQQLVVLVLVLVVLVQHQQLVVSRPVGWALLLLLLMMSEKYFETNWMGIMKY